MLAQQVHLCRASAESALVDAKWAVASIDQKGHFDSGTDKAGVPAASRRRQRLGIEEDHLKRGELLLTSGLEGDAVVFWYVVALMADIG